MLIDGAEMALKMLSLCRTWPAKVAYLTYIFTAVSNLYTLPSSLLTMSN